MHIQIYSNLFVPCIFLILITKQTKKNPKNKKNKEIQSYFRPTWMFIYYLFVFESRSSSCVVHAPLLSAKNEIYCQIIFSGTSVHIALYIYIYVRIYNQ